MQDKKQQLELVINNELVQNQGRNTTRLYIDAEYIMRNARLDEAQAGIKTAGKNINNLRYADDTTLMAESEEEVKSLLRRVIEESEKSWLETQHPKN